MKKLISVCLALCLLLSCFSLFALAENKPVLRFGDDGKFTILHLTDPQDDENIADELVGFIKEAIELSQPDLIVLTGDIIEDSRPVFDGFTDDEPFVEGVKSKDYAKALASIESAVAQIFAPLEESGIPYAITQGNNDYKGGISNEDWLRIYAQYPGCITFDQSSDSEGKIDYYLEILSSSSDEAAFGLWMLDNGRGFDEEQTAWMTAFEAAEVPSIVFEHVPTVDVGNLFEKCKPWNEGAFANGTTAYRLNLDVATGHAEFGEDPGQVSSQFPIWKEKGVIGAFFGHEHTCGYTGTVDGITLGLTYGCQFAKRGPYGMRTLVLDEDGTFTTDLYTYADGAFTLQADNEPYETYDSTFKKLFAGIANLFRYIVRSVDYLLKL